MAHGNLSSPPTLVAKGRGGHLTQLSAEKLLDRLEESGIFYRGYGLTGYEGEDQFITSIIFLACLAGGHENSRSSFIKEFIAAYHRRYQHCTLKGEAAVEIVGFMRPISIVATQESVDIQLWKHNGRSQVPCEDGRKPCEETKAFSSLTVSKHI